MPVTRYIWDTVNDNVLMQKDENGDTSAVYTHEPGLRGNLISQRRGENTSFYHYDGLGSTVALTNESEEVTDTYLQRAYGEPVSTTGSTVTGKGAGRAAVTPGPNRTTEPSTRSGTASRGWTRVCRGVSCGPLNQWLPRTVAL